MFGAWLHKFRVIFDQITPVPLHDSLEAHVVSTADKFGWAVLTDGDLLSAAEDSNFEIFIMTDKNLQYQQNLKSRKIAIKIAIVVLSVTSWPQIRNVSEEVAAAVERATKNYF